MAIRFDGRVAIVTGAGGGVGRAHALELARRGAKVVVNDLGGAIDGSGGSSAQAEAVVAEIKAAGGEAISDGGSVTDQAGVDNMVKRTMEQWGRIDILINNAGILRDKTFSKMEIADFRAVLEVHLMGSVICTKAVWPIMREQQYGRIVVTTSVTGLYGNFGQTNYGAAKAGLYGFMNVAKMEGARDNIRINTISPFALTRMTEGMITGERAAMYGPELVSPAVMYLVSEDAPTGIILSAGAGTVSRAAMVETQGVNFGMGITAEDVAAHFDEINDFSTAKPLRDAGEQSAKNAETLAKTPLKG
ncbi:SDR family NAD(P)-dependent oxidoreductase [Iodidimonas sp. SYSU 1G8]|uniref:SDR family NAD(P)-dependent oxidoreductase n=1 Tax=Iodidimonas sp. SYSU 1G8 TaxID=3133967 RepID=UPI0031FE52A7